MDMPLHRSNRQFVGLPMLLCLSKLFVPFELDLFGGIRPEWNGAVFQCLLQCVPKEARQVAAKRPFLAKSCRIFPVQQSKLGVFGAQDIARNCR